MLNRPGIPFAHYNVSEFLTGQTETGRLHLRSTMWAPDDNSTRLRKIVPFEVPYRSSPTERTRLKLRIGGVVIENFCHIRFLY